MEKIRTLSVEVRDDLIVVMQHFPEFIAVYAMAPDEPQLKLQSRSKADDHTLWRKPGRRPMRKRASLGGSRRVIRKCFTRSADLLASSF